MKIRLTISFRRADVAAFWIVGTVMSCAVAAVLAHAAGATWWWAAIGVAILLPGVFWVKWFELGVMCWNKMVRVSVPLLRAFVLRVCYYVLIGTVRHAGSTLSSDRTHQVKTSGWMLRTNGIVRTGAWTMCLQPVLLLLTILGDEVRQSGPPSGTYTLY